MKAPAKRGLLLVAAALWFGAGWGLPRAAAQATAESKNVVLIGHNDLNGHGDGGEDWCLSVVDVTHPEKPVMVAELPSPTPGITRCDSLGLSGNVLAVADQTLKQGQKMAGMWVRDRSDFARIQK